MTRRCRWCGMFVPATTEPTTRTVLGAVDGVQEWRTFRQTLCRGCSAAWSIDTPWNEPARPGIAPLNLDLEEAHEHR